MRCFKAGAFTGVVIESIQGEGDLLRGKAHLLRKELSDQAVHVLVGAANPGGIGMDEKKLCIEISGDLSVTPDLGKFEVPNSNQIASYWLLIIVNRQR